MEMKTVKIDELKPNDGLFVENVELFGHYSFYTLEKFRKKAVEHPGKFGKVYLAEKVKPTARFSFFCHEIERYIESEDYQEHKLVPFSPDGRLDVLDDEGHHKLHDLLVELMDKSGRFQLKTEIEVDWSSIGGRTPEADADPEKIQHVRGRITYLYLSNAIEEAMKCDDDTKKKIGEWLYKMSYHVRGL